MRPFLNLSTRDAVNNVAVGETVWLRLRAECPADLTHGVSIPAINHARRHLVTLDTDLLSQEVTLGPGEECSLCIGVRFERQGHANLNEFLIQANPVGGPSTSNQLVPLPDHPLLVIPSLHAELDTAVERICEYGDAVKVEVVIRHRGTTELSDAGWEFGPSERIRAGVTRRRLTTFRPGQELRCELVVVGGSVSVTTAATVGGERVERVAEHSVPADSVKSAVGKPFTFLEPKRLTTDRIDLRPEKSSVPVRLSGGVYTVRGAKSRYVLTIYPTHPNAASVRVFASPGRIEVEPRANIDGGWQFLLTVVDDPKLTGGLRLDYDVRAGSELLQGEIHFSIRPNNWTLWVLAITGGLALTTKGAIALLPTLFKEDSYEGLSENFWDLLTLRLSDWLQMASIPLVRLLLWAADSVQRQFQDS